MCLTHSTKRRIFRKQQSPVNWKLSIQTSMVRVKRLVLEKNVSETKQLFLLFCLTFPVNQVADAWIKQEISSVELLNQHKTVDSDIYEKNLSEKSGDNLFWRTRNIFTFCAFCLFHPFMCPMPEKELKLTFLEKMKLSIDTLLQTIQPESVEKNERKDGEISRNLQVSGLCAYQASDWRCKTEVTFLLLLVNKETVHSDLHRKNETIVFE